MHPIEHLRMVARAEGAGPSLLAREAGRALAGFAFDPAAVVTGCRRLVERHPDIGPMWWLASRVLASADGAAEAGRAAHELEKDATASTLAAELPPDATLVVVGWPEQAATALRRRGDLEVLAVDHDGEGMALARRLASQGAEVSEVPASGVGAAVVVSDLVLLEAVSAGPDGFLAAPGSRAAAAVAAVTGIDVWLAVGVGRVLPARLWESQLARLDASGDEPWDRPVEVVPAGQVSVCVGPRGPFDPSALGERADCPVAPELLRPPD